MQKTSYVSIERGFSMAGFIQALRNARKKTKDKTDYSARGKEIVAILKKYDYSDGLTPKMTVDIAYVYHYIKDWGAEAQTRRLREMLATTDNKEQQTFKKLNFETVCFAGRFSYRNARKLIERSPFIVIDVDHLETTERARDVQQLFIRDTSVETALCFLSPRGEGVKWVVCLPEWCQGLAFKEQFMRICKYVSFNYGIEVDSDGHDVSRACYLSHDPECYVNEKYITNQ